MGGKSLGKRETTGRRIDELEKSRIIQVAQSLIDGALEKQRQPFQCVRRQPACRGLLVKQPEILEEMASRKVRVVVITLQETGSFLSNVGA